LISSKNSASGEERERQKRGGKLQQRKKKVGKFLDVGRAGILGSYIGEFRF
jgi:hypothetical protein